MDGPGVTNPLQMVVPAFTKYHYPDEETERNASAYRSAVISREGAARVLARARSECQDARARAADTRLKKAEAQLKKAEAQLQEAQKRFQDADRLVELAWRSLETPYPLFQESVEWRDFETEEDPMEEPPTSPSYSPTSPARG